MSEYGIVPKQRDPGGWRLDTFGALRLALSRAFPPPEAANFRRFAAQRVKPAGEQFGTMPLVPLAALLTPHASPPTWHRPHDRWGGARRRCPTPIWVQHSPPARSQHATRCYVCRLWSRVWHVNLNLLPWHRRSSYEPDAPARGVPQSPRWRVELVCARMRNFLAGVIPWFSTLLAEHHQGIRLALIQPRGLSRPTY